MCLRRVEYFLILHSCTQRFTTLSLIGFIGPTKVLGSIFKGICRQLETNQKVVVTEDCGSTPQITSVCRFNIPTSVSLQTQKLYFCNISTKASLTITRARRIPRQLRGPIPNGRYVYGLILPLFCLLNLRTHQTVSDNHVLQTFTPFLFTCRVETPLARASAQGRGAERRSEPWRSCS